MRATRHPLILIALLLLAGCRHRPSAPPQANATSPEVLHSPWDATLIPVSHTAFLCGAPISLTPDLTVSTEPSTALEDLSTRVLTAADVYRNTGSDHAAHCVLTLLSSAAASRAMTGTMSSSAAWQQQNITLRAAAVAFLKVRNSEAVTPQQASQIISWLVTLTRKERTYIEHLRCDDHTCDIKTHRGLSVAIAAATVAIASNDRSLYRWATAQYRTAVADITPEGMLPRDTEGRFAFLFNLESAASLVQIAELGEVNGDRLYSLSNNRVQLLTQAVARGLIDTAPYAAITHQPQKFYNPILPWQVAWASVYNRRFPDPNLTSLLRQVSPHNLDMWGTEALEPEEFNAGR